MGGANKTISFKDQKLFDFIEEVCSVLELNGPCDMDFFMKDGEYYLNEINPDLVELISMPMVQALISSNSYSTTFAELRTKVLLGNMKRIL